jgi:hypothetical protein
MVQSIFWFSMRCLCTCVIGELLPVINIKGFKFTNSTTSVAQLRTGIFPRKITLILSRKFNPYLEQSLLTAD